MTYLLEVNALVALGFTNHEFYDRVASWFQSSHSPQLASCSITELGFLRVLAQAPAHGFTVAQARTLLLRLKEGLLSRLTFIPDEPMFLIFPVGSERISKLPMAI
jgi:predicted nucleic acid-binding protein